MLHSLRKVQINVNIQYMQISQKKKYFTTCIYHFLDLICKPNLPVWDLSPDSVFDESSPASAHTSFQLRSKSELPYSLTDSETKGKSKPASLTPSELELFLNYCRDFCSTSPPSRRAQKRLFNVLQWQQAWRTPFITILHHSFSPPFPRKGWQRCQMHQKFWFWWRTST